MFCSAAQAHLELEAKCVELQQAVAGRTEAQVGVPALKYGLLSVVVTCSSERTLVY